MQGDFSDLGVASGVEDVHIREGNAERVRGGDEDTGLGGGEDIASDNNNELRKRISSHPLYDKLVEIHLDCLKVSGVDNLDVASQITTPQLQHRSEPDRSFPDHFSDIDQFMEEYCLVLSKLREAMEEPQQEAMSFIDGMQSQLEEIIESHEEEQPQPSSSCLSGVAASWGNQHTRAWIWSLYASSALAEVSICSSLLFHDIVEPNR